MADTPPERRVSYVSRRIRLEIVDNSTIELRVREFGSRVAIKLNRQQLDELIAALQTPAPSFPSAMLGTRQPAPRIEPHALAPFSGRMDDAELVNQVAVEFLAREGPNAIVTLRERAEIAAGIGDDFSLGQGRLDGPPALGLIAEGIPEFIRAAIIPRLVLERIRS